MIRNKPWGFPAGDTSYGKFLQDIKHRQFKDSAQVFKDLDGLTLEDDEDAFGWCAPAAPEPDVPRSARAVLAPGKGRFPQRSCDHFCARKLEESITKTARFTFCVSEFFHGQLTGLL